MSDEAAIKAHSSSDLPVAIVLCSWMPSGQDWTPTWRKARVAEYILLGECNDESASYNASHGGYERVVLSEVSRAMLHHADGMPAVAERRGGGVCCAVAFRRKK